jgi:hypothetical protein
MSYRYQNISSTRNEDGIPYIENNIYPSIPIVQGDSYVITTMEDRLDIMANSFYGDSSYWWVIASANALPGDSLFPPLGMQLRIPVDLETALSEYKQINVIR